MARFTLTEAREFRALWLEAYKAASTGKSYTIENRSLTRQDLAQIKKELSYWDDIIDGLTGRSSGRVISIIPLDR